VGRACCPAAPPNREASFGTYRQAPGHERGQDANCPYKPTVRGL
jgi:hypothetical protein